MTELWTPPQGLPSEMSLQPGHPSTHNLPMYNPPTWASLYSQLTHVQPPNLVIPPPAVISGISGLQTNHHEVLHVYFSKRTIKSSKNFLVSSVAFLCCTTSQDIHSWNGKPVYFAAFFQQKYYSCLVGGVDNGGNDGNVYMPKKGIS